MVPENYSYIQSVLIFKSDRIYANALHEHAQAVFPGAEIIIAHSLESAHLAMTGRPIDIFVTGVGASLGHDVLDVVARPGVNPTLRARHVVVVTTRHEYRVFAALRTLGVDGVFDSASEPPAAFETALRAVANGKRYWSQSVLNHMNQVGMGNSAVFRLLTLFEQVVLSVIGDGCDNTVAAQRLRLSPATVSTVRRELHRKLGVQHRGELVRVAAQHGFVRFTPTGVVRPGFSLMCALYESRRTKRALLRSPVSTAWTETGARTPASQR